MTITTRIWVLIGVAIGLGGFRWFILRQMESLESKIVKISMSKLKDGTIHPDKGHVEMRSLELCRMVYSITKIGIYFLIGNIFLINKQEFIQNHVNAEIIMWGGITIAFMLVEVTQYDQKRRRIIRMGKTSRLEDVECLKRRNLTYLPIKTIIEYKGIIPWLVIIPNLLEVPTIGKMYMRNFEEPSKEYLDYLFQREPKIAKWSVGMRNIGLVSMSFMIVGYLYMMY